jgi:SAM-dependent methyltransferase
LANGPPQREIAALGDVAGKSLVQLQCHFGMDALRWARIGASVTGVDFSPDAVAEAVDLAMRAGLSDRARFVWSNVYDAPTALVNERFDIVYVSLGSIGWLPDVAKWGEVVVQLLKPDGKVYLHDVHPYGLSLDDDGERVECSYFGDPDEPRVSDEPYTYTDGGNLSATTTYEWNHSMSEIITSLTSQGLVLNSFLEHDWTLFQEFPWLTQTPSGEFVIPEGRPRIPLSFTVVAHAPR